MITVESLTRKYGGFTAVDDVTFTARPGRVTGFLGPNGAGKSTTMRIMVGLTPATSGTAPIDGAPLRRPAQPRPRGGRPARRLRPARRPHRPRDPDHRPAHHGAADGPRRRDARPGQPDAAGGGPPGPQLLPRHAAAARHRRRPASATREVLILDEPANGLDPAGIRWMRDLLREFADRGGTVLLSSHLLHEIEVIADDIVVIGNGRIVAQGTKAELLAGGRHPRPHARRRAARPRRWPPRASRAAPSTAACAPTPTPTWSVASPSAPASPSPSCGPPTAPASRRCSSSSPPTPSEKEQRHDRHDRPARRPSPPRRPRASARSSRRSRMGRIVGVELRKMFDTRAGFWLLASIGILSVLATGAAILFAPDADIDLQLVRQRDRRPDGGDPADDRDPVRHRRVEPAQRAHDVHAGPAPRPHHRRQGIAAVLRRRGLDVRGAGDRRPRQRRSAPRSPACRPVWDISRHRVLADRAGATCSA